METPSLSHIKDCDYDDVYEPAEDSFLMLDALELEMAAIEKSRPSICLEVGSGSGINITAFAKRFNYCFCLAVDINDKACKITKKTAETNLTLVECINMDLVGGLKHNLVDVVIFNPPYVVTESLEIGKDKLSSAWAGGLNGREVIDRFLVMLPRLLSKTGVCYMLVIQENIPDEIVVVMKGLGFSSSCVISRKAYNEKLMVLKFVRMEIDSL